MTVYALRLQNNTDTALRARMADLLGLTPGAGINTARSGLRPDNGGSVSRGGGSMAVQVNAFSAWVSGSSASQGGYPFVSDSIVTLVLSPGHATLPRVDTIAAVVYDNSFDGSGQLKADVIVVQGTPGQGAPALPAASIPLRDVTVRAGVSSGTGGLAESDLGTDRRTWLAAAGGVLNVASQTERDALPVRNGQVVYRGDTNRLELRRASGWGPLAVETTLSKSTGAATASQTTTTATPPGLLQTVTTGSGSILDVRAEPTMDANGTIWALDLIIDGALVQDTGLINVSGLLPISRTFRVTGLSAGAHTITLRARWQAGGSVSLVAGSTMVVEHRAA